MGLFAVQFTHLETVSTATPQAGILNWYPPDALPVIVEFWGVMETIPG